MKTERQEADCLSNRVRARSSTTTTGRTIFLASFCFTLSTGSFVRAFPTPVFPSLQTMSPLRRSTRSQRLLLSNTASDASSGLLQSWLQHSSTDFHALTDDEAATIRNALLIWYRQHRRKLPWRGDPPPWQGSTADFGKNPSKKCGTQQQQLTDFFCGKKNATTAKQRHRDEESSAKSCVGSDSSSFPVTAYGIWVSEVMLQQTRIVGTTCMHSCFCPDRSHSKTVCLARVCVDVKILLLYRKQSFRIGSSG